MEQKLCQNMSSLQHIILRSFCLLLVLWRLLGEKLSICDVIIFLKGKSSSRECGGICKIKENVRLLLFLSLTQCAFVSNTYLWFKIVLLFTQLIEICITRKKDSAPWYYFLVEIFCDHTWCKID